jgi:hypothetical protein
MKHRIPLFISVLVCGISLPSLSGLLIFPFSAVVVDHTLVYAIILSALFLLIAFFTRNRKSLRRYWQIFFAFFIASLAILFDLLVNLSSETESGLVLDMLVSTSIIVSVIVILTRVSGKSLGSIFLIKGNLRLGLISGLIGFFFFALTASARANSILGSALFHAGTDIPIFLGIFSNAF